MVTPINQFEDFLEYREQNPSTLKFPNFIASFREIQDIFHLFGELVQNIQVCWFQYNKKCCVNVKGDDMAAATVAVTTVDVMITILERVNIEAQRQKIDGVVMPTLSVRGRKRPQPFGPLRLVFLSSN